MKKKINTLRKVKELLTGSGKTLYQVNLATEHYAQIIGLSKGRRYWRSVAYLLKVVR